MHPPQRCSCPRRPHSLLPPGTCSLPDRRVAMLGLAALLWANAASALEQPKGPVLLTVTGKIGERNGAGSADFDLAMLDALPQHSFVTRTPWFEGAHKFSGPLLREVLAAAGAKGSSLRAVALNDYKVEIPIEDARLFPLIMATRLDNQPMRVRDKGPLFIVYPFDDSADLRSERYYSRSAWQLRRLEVR